VWWHQNGQKQAEATYKDGEEVETTEESFK